MPIDYTLQVASVSDPTSFVSLMAAINSLLDAESRWDVDSSESTSTDKGRVLKPGTGSNVPDCRVVIAGSTLSRGGVGEDPDPLMPGAISGSDACVYAENRVYVGLAPRAGVSASRALFHEDGPFPDGTAYCGLVAFAPTPGYTTSTPTLYTMYPVQVILLQSLDDMALYVRYESEDSTLYHLYGCHVGFGGQAEGTDGEDGLVAFLASSGVVTTGSASPGITDAWPRIDNSTYGTWMDGKNDSNSLHAALYFFPPTDADNFHVAIQTNPQRSSPTILDTTLGGNRRYPLLEYADHASGKRAFATRIGYGRGFWHGLVDSSSGTDFYTAGRLTDSVTATLMYPKAGG